jgi:hypothetical protein
VSPCPASETPPPDSGRGRCVSGGMPEPQYGRRDAPVRDGEGLPAASRRLPLSAPRQHPCTRLGAHAHHAKTKVARRGEGGRLPIVACRDGRRRCLHWEAPEGAGAATVVRDRCSAWPPVPGPPGASGTVGLFVTCVTGERRRRFLILSASILSRPGWGEITHCDQTVIATEGWAAPGPEY